MQVIKCDACGQEIPCGGVVRLKVPKVKRWCHIFELYQKVDLCDTCWHSLQTVAGAINCAAAAMKTTKQ